MSSETEQQARNRLLARKRLLDALRALGGCCHSPVQEASWPSDALLHELDFSVEGLARMELKRPITVHTPYWKAYEWVNKREPGIRLIPRVKDLVGRADKLLRDAGEPELVRLRRKASGGAPEAQRLVKALEAIQEDASKAGKIDWNDYEGLLFSGSDNKPVQLACGDLPASSRVRCYARALEILTDDLRYRPLRDKSLPLLVWLSGTRSPHAEMLKHDYRMQYCDDYIARHLTDAIKARQREQWRERQTRRRHKKLRAKLLAVGISDAECEEILAANA
jgi:hypothetical protein